MGKTSKLNNSKSRASGTGWLVVTDGGRAKASVHHDSQSNDCVCSGKGSETVCFLGAQSDPRDFLTAGSSEPNSDKRLFSGRGREGEESSLAQVVGREGEWELKEVILGEAVLNSIRCHSMPCKMKERVTHSRRLRGKGEIGWDSGRRSEQDRFRFRESWESSWSPDPESVELARVGVADGLRDGGDGCEVISWMTGDVEA